MKKLIGSVFVFCLLSLSAMAQSGKPTKIHFFNGLAGIPVEIRLVRNSPEPIRVKSRTWIIIETTSDSLGFTVNDKPYFVYFEPGKTYYFVSSASSKSHVIITEESERAFMMTVSINSARGPEEYKLGKLAN